MEADLNESCAGGQCSFLRLSHVLGQISEGGWRGDTEALRTLPCQLCFKLVLWRPATRKERKKERKKERERMRERERDHHHYGQTDMMPSTLNDILRNSLPPEKTITRKKNFFLIQIS